MLPLKITSGGQLLAALKQRAAKWSGVNASARLVAASPDLDFWYYHEVGTAPFSIDPVTAKKLAFPGDGGTVLRDHVDHPGLKPRRMVTKVLPDIEAKTLENVNEALGNGGLDNPQVMREAIIKSVHDAKELIVQSIADNLPGTRPLNPEYPKQSGKLEGRTAAEVFEEKASVIAGE